MQKITALLLVTSMLTLMLEGCPLLKPQDGETKYSVWDKTYECSATLVLKIEDNIWKVDSYEFGKTTEV